MPGSRFCRPVIDASAAVASVADDDMAGEIADIDALVQALRGLPGVRRVAWKAGPDDGRLLLYPRHDSAFVEMLPIARLARERRGYRPVFLFATEESEARIADCEAEGFDFVQIDPIPPQDRGVSGHGTMEGLRRIPATRRRLREDRARLRALLECIDPFFLGVPGDRELGPTPPLLGAARDLGVPSMIVSPAFPSIDSEAKKRAEPRRFRARLGDGAPLINSFAARRLPGQVCDTPFGQRLFTPGWLTLALQAEGVLPTRPWHQGGGLSDFLIVHGKEQEARFRAMGCGPGKIKVFGHLEHDLLHRAWSGRAGLRKDLIERHGLEPDRPLAVFAVPSYAEQDLMPMARHLELLEGYGEALAASRAQVVLSLHPKSRPEDYRDFSERHGFPLESARLFDLLPAADLFVAGGSTTIDWAILCGIPVIDIDTAALNLKLWSDEPAVLAAKSLDTFQDALDGLLEQPDGLEKAAEIQKKRSSELAVFDGQVAERFLTFLDGLKKTQGAGAESR